jgi:hypothetical protein
VIGERLSDELENGSMKTLADIWDLLTNAVSDIENIRDEFQDGLDNMPEGLQQGDTGQLIQERIDGLEEWLQELNTAADEINEMDPDGETGSDESETECATCGFTKLQHAADYALDLIPERTHDPCGTWLNPEVLEAAAEMAAEAAGSCSL